jgi:hypothetical protein
MMMSTWARLAGDNMWPSIETLSRATGLHRDTVQRALSEAVNHGYVIREPRGPGPDPVTAARLHGYKYSAAIPDSWPIAWLDERWERDPEFVSERTLRPRRRPGRVPDEDRDTTGSVVPVVRSQRPGPVRETSRSCAVDVPAQTGMKASSEGIHSKKHTKSEGDARAKNGDERKIRIGRGPIPDEALEVIVRALKQSGFNEPAQIVHKLGGPERCTLERAALALERVA